jgi:F420-non-reducing hydrogenase iron-sulfur subunit
VKMENFEPKIVGFVCRWCSGSAMDLAGVTRMTYPPNVRPIQLPCTGAVDPAYILRALLAGADGVFISGCPPGDCHYVSGNLKFRRRFAVLRALLAGLGLEPKRLKLYWINAAEGKKFAQTMQELTEEIRALGPNPFGRGSFT